jgi:metal-responsive CopG/Arc/MetJ family transcriptional regulator
VDVPAQSRRAVRINVSLPEDVVQSIDRVSANRSRFLAETARERLKRQRKSP